MKKRPIFFMLAAAVAGCTSLPPLEHDDGGASVKGAATMGAAVMDAMTVGAAVTDATTMVAATMGCEAYEPASHAAVYYVDSRMGSDASDGAAAERAWRSLDELRNVKLRPGDIVRLARGSTFATGLVVTDSGEEGRPITIEPFGAGDPPVITLPDKPGVSCVWIDASYVVVLGIRVENVVEDGIKLTQNASHDVVCGTEETDVGIGIVVGGSHQSILSNYAHDLHMVNDTPGGNDDFGAVGISIEEGSFNEIAYNRCVRCAAPSQDYGTDGGAVETYGSVADISIHHNYAESTNGFLEMGLGTARRVHVAYNVLWNSTYGTFVGLNFDGKFAGDYEVVIENNTFVNTSADYPSYNAAIGFWGEPVSAERVTLRNNIIQTAVDAAKSSTFTHDHNLYSFLGEGTLGAFALGEGESIADPKFVDVRAGDLRLSAGSTAIDRGAPSAYAADMTGAAVPNGRAPDIGAYEFQH